MSKKKTHNFAYRFCAWLVCINCGLVALNNKASRKEMAKPCKGDDE